MSLNDNVMDGIEGDTALALDGVVPPNTKDSTVAAMINVDATTQGKDNTTTMNNNEIASLPDMAVKMRLLTDRGTKIVEMQDLRDDIEEDGSMSRPKAGVIEATFENFFSATNPAGGYTALESRTNLLYATNFMTARIQASHEALAADLAIFAHDGMGQAANVAESVRDSRMLDASRAIYDAAQVVQELSCDLSKAKNLVFPYNGGFVNFAKDDLSQIQIGDIVRPKLNNYPLNSEKFRAAYQDLVSLWADSVAVRAVFHPRYKELAAVEGGDGPQMSPITLQMLLISFASADDSVYTQVINMAQNALENIERQQAKIQAALQQDVSQTSIFLSKEGSDIENSLQVTACIERSVQEITNFATAAAVVIAGLSALNAM